MKKSISSYAILAAAGVLALGLGSQTANATTPVTSNLAVNAQVVATCSISAQPLNFGIYTGAAINQTAPLTIICTNNTPYTIALGPSSHGGSITARQMQDGTSDTLNYNLYYDAQMTKNWGNTAVGTDMPNLPNGTGSAQTVTVYGVLPQNQPLFVGTYSDNVTATLTY